MLTCPTKKNKTGRVGFFLDTDVNPKEPMRAAAMHVHHHQWSAHVVVHTGLLLVHLYILFVRVRNTLIQECTCTQDALLIGEVGLEEVQRQDVGKLQR